MNTLRSIVLSFFQGAAVSAGAVAFVLLFRATIGGSLSINVNLPTLVAHDADGNPVGWIEVANADSFEENK